MPRELENWLDSYLEYTDNSESPLSYHEWCGLSVIAGALQRKVYLKWGIGQVIYPNLYVVLVGQSGRTRKGVALGLGKDLLKEVKSVTITPESSSGRQAMTMIMKKATTNFQDTSDGKLKFQSAVTTFSEELSVFLGQGDIGYLSNLTDWYDSKDLWEYESVGRGRDSINGVCLNLIGGTAPEWLQSMIPYEAIGGGFTSRVIFVVEENKRKLVPEHTVTDRELWLQEKLINDLERINKLVGEVKMGEEAKAKYVEWYIAEDGKMSAGNYAIPDTRFAGYCERRATHLRKLMMLFSVSHSDTRIIEGVDFDKALHILTEVEKKMAKTFGGLGRGKNSDATEAIKDYIQQVGITTRKLLLQRFYRDVDSTTLAGIETTLVQMGLIKTKLLVKERDIAYEWLGNTKQ